MERPLIHNLRRRDLPCLNRVTLIGGTGLHPAFSTMASNKRRMPRPEQVATCRKEGAEMMARVDRRAVALFCTRGRDKVERVRKSRFDHLRTFRMYGRGHARALDRDLNGIS